MILSPLSLCRDAPPFKAPRSLLKPSKPPPPAGARIAMLEKQPSAGISGAKQQEKSVGSLKEQDYLGMSEVSSPGLRRSATNLVDLRHLQLERLGDSENAGTSLSLGFQQVGTVEQPCKGTKRVYCEAFGSSTGSPLGFNSPPACRSKEEGPCQEQPEARAPVVGWPPVQSFRKQSFALSAHLQPKKEAEHTAQAGVPSNSLVKVYMDGVSIGRKVDINLFHSYERLSGSLEEMFSYHICDLKLSGSEHVLTYEDKDGDLMLVGDVPWNMFKAAVKRLRIMKGSEAIGLVK